MTELCTYIRFIGKAKELPNFLAGLKTGLIVPNEEDNNVDDEEQQN
jgi:hypothetical protein